MHFTFWSVHIALLCFIDNSSVWMGIILWYSIFSYVGNFKSLKHWILYTNVNISSQNKKHFRSLLFHLFTYSKSSQTLMPNDKETTEAFLSILHQKRKHTIAIFRKILSWKIIIEFRNLAKQDSLRYSFFTVLYYRGTFGVLIYITWKSVFHDRMPVIYRHLF